MFGVNLIHAGFLAAAAAVSVPILIHLLMRPRARLVSIGTLRFLKLALKEINAAGGVNGKKIDLRTVDNQSTNPGALAALQKLRG